MTQRIKWWGWTLLIVGIALAGCTRLNDYQTEGTLKLTGLTQPVKVMRDEKGMPYVYAQNDLDAFRAIGFVTAQDRLFQMELTRLFASGRICELAGEKAIALDTRMRTIGFLRNAHKQAELLNQAEKKIWQAYVDGINAYIENYKDSHHLEFKLAGIKPAPWAVTDSLAIACYMAWDTSANLKTEVIAQMLLEKLGPGKASEIMPLNVNPDDTRQLVDTIQARRFDAVQTGLAANANLAGFLQPGALEIGSNNWAVNGKLSSSGNTVVANDPHLDTQLLPGPLYPCGLITPDLRVVGVMVPGFPAIPIFRNSYVAIGATNAYGDVQDLYVETIDPNDPDRYLEGDRSLAFKVIEETLNIRDKQAPDGYRKENITIRLTKRGPVISDVWPRLETDRIITVRFAPFETMQPTTGILDMIKAKSVQEMRKALGQVNWIVLNFVFGDKNGNIGWHVSGKLPIRSQGDGTFPYPVEDETDNWIGWIPFDEMPHRYNPERGWIGTCNHKTVAADYPYYFSSHTSPSYRYRRLSQLLNSTPKKSVDDHWRYQRDTLNLMAAKLVPVLAEALKDHEDTSHLAKILSDWDLHDDPQSIAPTVFHTIYEKTALMVYQDELGEELARTMLSTWYFWQERFQQLVMAGESMWFDDVTTPDVQESLNDMIYLAAIEAQATLKATADKDLATCQWGEVHQHEFLSPIRRQGFGKGLLGGGSHPAGGSGEVLYRGIYEFNAPYGVKTSAALRMVADLADEEKILAVLPGGVTGRLFNPHATDQIEAFMDGTKQYWWFSDQAIQAHTQSILELNP